MSASGRIDPEKLAALLDGRLGEAEAALLRAELANADDETIAAYADAVAVVGEGSAKADVVPLPTAWTVRRLTPWLGAAAAILVVAIGLNVNRTRADGAREALRGGAAALPSSASLPNAPLWGVTRGGSEQLSQHVRAVRVGILSADLALALDRNDIQHRRAYLSGLARTLNVLTAGGLETRLQTASEDTSRASVPFIVSLVRDAMQVDSDITKSAAWLETARLAGVAGESAFQRQRAADAITGLISGVTLDAEQRAVVDQARAVLTSPTSRPADIGEAITKLLGVMTR